MNDKPELFSEIYSIHYRVVEQLARFFSSDGTGKDIVDAKDFYTALTKVIHSAIVDDLGYDELDLEQEIRSKVTESWNLFDAIRGRTIFDKTPYLPLTGLERQFMKTILQDPRVRLFDLEGECQKLVEDWGEELLYDMEDIVIYDRYGDVDPFEDPVYIDHFHTILEAIHDFSPVSIRFINRAGEKRHAVGDPKCIEYSQKDDKFRIILADKKYEHSILVTSIQEVESSEDYTETYDESPQTCLMKLILHDERNALERVAMNFSHYRKKVQVASEETEDYVVEVEYDREEEKDIVIRVLSFGPYIEVLEPQSVRDEVDRRLREQKKLFEGE